MNDSPSPPVSNPGPVSRRAAIKARLDEMHDRVEQTREKVPAVDAAFAVRENSERMAGSLLASAIAYRLFLWLLPLTLILASVLGFVQSGGGDTAEVSRDLGLSTYVASTVSDAASQAERSRWVILFVAAVALYSASSAGARALRALHQLAWGIPIDRGMSAVRGAAGFLMFTLGAIVVGGATAWVRTRSSAMGLGATVVSVLLFAALWLVASMFLPHADAPWNALIPGAIVVGAGVQILHLITVYYISGKLKSSSQLYGALGSAAAVLLWMYFIGYIIVAAATVNATLWNRRMLPGVSEQPAAERADTDEKSP